MTIIRNKLDLILINFDKFNKIVFVLIFSIIFLKHTNRIINNFNTKPVIPNIYSDDSNVYRKNHKILKGNKTFFYIPNKRYNVGMCYYSAPPCTHTYSDIDPDQLILDNFYNYKIYYYIN